MGSKNLTKRQIVKEYASVLISGHFKALAHSPYDEPLNLKSGQIRNSLRTPLILVEWDPIVFVLVLKH